MEDDTLQFLFIKVEHAISHWHGLMAEVDPVDMTPELTDLLTDVAMGMSATAKELVTQVRKRMEER